ncbi:MAG TPA: hypothetical protein VFU19_15415 [Iamia sp.]|nr:hypothetical protein [Iamia sp.]
MASPDASPRPRGLGLVVAAIAGLVLTFGGLCGVGPTSLSLLAVSGTQTPTPDDARSQVPVPTAAEVAEPARRRVVVRSGLRGGRALVGRARRAVGTWAAGVVARRGPPPLRGPPLLVA